MKNKTRLFALGLAVTILAAIIAPGKAFAISNWARKYNVDCLTCHSPAVPRLNAFGHQFRKMGYRMDTEIKAGKPEAYREIGNYVSVRLRTGYSIEHFDKPKGGSADNFNAFHTRNGFVDPDRSEEHT